MTTTSFLYPLFSRHTGKPAVISSFVGESWLRPLVRNIKTYLSPLTRMLNYYVKPAIELGTTAATAYHIGNQLVDSVRKDYSDYQTELFMKQHMPKTKLLGVVPPQAEDIANEVLRQEAAKLAGPVPLTADEYKQLYNVNPNLFPGERTGLLDTVQDDEIVPAEEIPTTEDERKLAAVNFPTHRSALMAKPGKKAKLSPPYKSFEGVEKSSVGRPPNNILPRITEYIGEVVSFMDKGYPADKAIIEAEKTKGSLVSGTQSKLYVRQIQNLLQDTTQLQERYNSLAWVPRPINEYVARLKGMKIDEEGKILS